MTLHPPVILEDLEVGSLFIYDGEYVLKTKYLISKGLASSYIVGSGELFLGGLNKPEDIRKLMVIPITI